MGQQVYDQGPEERELLDKRRGIQKWFNKAHYVELLFDSRARKVGLRPRSKPTRASHKLRESPQGGDRRYVSGARFLESCGVKLRKARSFDAKRNDRQKLVEFSLK